MRKNQEQDQDPNFDSTTNFRFGGGRGRARGRGRGRGRHWLGDYSLVDVRLVEPALLAFLQSENLHGYALLDKLENIGLGSINPSVVYRKLRDYEAMGLVESGWDEEKSQGPPRRVYSITEDGKQALKLVSQSLKETLERIETILLEINSAE